MKNIIIGKLGEKIAKEHLHKKGYQILKQNYHSHWGEIDIITKKNNKISFIEVKTRVGILKGKPYESVNQMKIKKLMRPIHHYLLQNNYKDYKLSLDVVSIVLDSNMNVEKITHFENVYA